MKKQIIIIAPLVLLFCLCNQQKSGGSLKAQNELFDHSMAGESSDKKRTTQKELDSRMNFTFNSKEEIYKQEIEFVPKNAIFIDPSYTGLEKGTKEQPYITFKKVNWKYGMNVLIKRGTKMINSFSIRPEADNIVIGAYGNGSRPIIKSTLTDDQKIFDLGGLTNTTVRDIEIESLDTALTCFHFHNSKGGKLINCKVQGSQWGIRNLSSSGTFQVINCEVSKTADDGIFIKDVDTVEFSGNYVHDVNQKYFKNPSEKFSGGDCIQLFNVKYFKITDNDLDHGSTGNKFCFISNGDEDKRATGIIERNIFTRKGAGILIYLDVADNVVIKQNRFINAEIAIYNHSANAGIYFNEFINIKDNVFMINSKGFGKLTEIINNTFTNINNLSNFYKEDILFANNIFYKCSGTMFTGTSKKKPTHNCYFDVKNLKDLDKDSSIFTDPLFKNSDSLNFSLKENSPCIKRGLFMNNKEHKVSDSAVDIGAHVFVPGSNR